MGVNLDLLRERVSGDNIPQENKDLILKFDKELASQGLAPSTRTSYMESLYYFSQHTNKPFSKVIKDDLLGYLSYLIDKKKLKPNTLNKHKVNIKRFYKWKEDTEEGYPKIVRWIKISNGNGAKKLPDSILSPEEVLQLVQGAEGDRDKAFIALLYDSGCRVGEILGLKIKNVVFDEHGGAITVNGKTGGRRVRLIDSVPYLHEWIKNHPYSNNPEEPLFITMGRATYGDNLNRNGAHGIIQRAVRASGFKKRVHPHLFRHSRLTELAKRGFNESELRIIAGWTPGSDMPKIYLHISGKDVDDKLLRVYGIKPEEEKEKESPLKPKKCIKCGKESPATARFCYCGMALDLKAAMQVDEEKRAFERRLSMVEESLAEVALEKTGVPSLTDLKQPQTVDIDSRTQAELSLSGTNFRFSDGATSWRPVKNRKKEGL